MKRIHDTVKIVMDRQAKPDILIVTGGKQFLIVKITNKDCDFQVRLAKEGIANLACELRAATCIMDNCPPILVIHDSEEQDNMVAIHVRTLEVILRIPPDISHEYIALGELTPAHEEGAFKAFASEHLEWLTRVAAP